MAIIRYPGSKSKLFKTIMRFMPDNMRLPLFSAAEPVEYREPFFGSGEFGLQLIEHVLNPRCSVWINDIDPGIVALWTAVLDCPARLCRLVQDFTPSADAFYDFKASDGLSSGDVALDGFRKLALHRMSVSGFGAMSGGPIGGRRQDGAYTVECRWSPSRIKRDVMRISRAMNEFKDLRISCVDFREMLHASESCFLYLDPPYYEKGEQLYKYNMSKDDHRDLAAALADTTAGWALSYDDHQQIRDMYSWADIHPIYVTYSNAVCKTETRPKNQEVVIVPRRQAIEKTA